MTAKKHEDQLQAKLTVGAVRKIVTDLSTVQSSISRLNEDTADLPKIRRDVHEQRVISKEQIELNAAIKTLQDEQAKELRSQRVELERVTGLYMEACQSADKRNAELAQEIREAVTSIGDHIDHTRSLTSSMENSLNGLRKDIAAVQVSDTRLDAMNKEVAGFRDSLAYHRWAMAVFAIVLLIAEFVIFFACRSTGGI